MGGGGGDRAHSWGGGGGGRAQSCAMPSLKRWPQDEPEELHDAVSARSRELVWALSYASSSAEEEDKSSD